VGGERGEVRARHPWEKKKDQLKKVAVVYRRNWGTRGKSAGLSHTRSQTVEKKEAHLWLEKLTKCQL